MATGDQCEHNDKLRLLGLCAKCKAKDSYLIFRLCKDKCFACNDCGYFWGPDNKAMNGQPAKFTPEPTKKYYTSESIRAAIAPKYAEYFAKLAMGQPPRWVCDQKTKDNFCLSQWLMDELISLGSSDLDRVDVQNFFNRKARAENDLYELAAKAMNSFLDNNIERYRRYAIQRRH